MRNAQLIMTPLIHTEQGWRREVDPTVHHRENHWDYKGRAIYLVTLCVDQRRSLLGTICGDSEQEVRFAPSELGSFVAQTFKNLPLYYGEKGYKIKVLALQLMPDHLHGIIQVIDPLPKSIGEIIRSFKSVCTTEWRKGQQNTDARLWEVAKGGYHERILHKDGQLNNMIQYVKDNPRRRWLKKHHPELFTMRNDFHYSYTDDNGLTHDWHFRAMGNKFLWDWPLKQFVQCSRSCSAEKVEELKQECLRNAQQGVVSISPAISEGERLIIRAIREAGFPTIILLKDGFPKEGDPHERYYKPSGIYYDLCAQGKLLLLEPYSEFLQDAEIREAVYSKDPRAVLGTTRYHFLALNYVAMTMSIAALKNEREMHNEE